MPNRLLAIFLICSCAAMAQGIDGSPSSGPGSGTVTSVAAGQCMTPATITSTGTIGFSGIVNPQTSTYQAVASDFSLCKTITVASGTFTITLVASGTQPANGSAIHAINYGSGVVTIRRSGQNINGGTADIVLAAGSATAPTSTYITSDGTNYFTTGSGSASSGIVNTVASSATPAFDLSLGTIQYIAALATNAVMTVSNIRTGGAYTFDICLDATGSETFTWAGSFHGAMTIGTMASKCNVQQFISPDGTNLYSTSTGVINQ